MRPHICIELGRTARLMTAQGCVSTAPVPWNWPSHVTGLPVTSRAPVALAAQTGDLALVRWLHSHGCPLSEDCLLSAARAGNSALLDWLIAAGCQLDPDSRTSTTAFVHLEHRGVISWMTAQGRQLCAITFSRAVANCSAGFLVWLRDQGCPWDAASCTRAALYGRLDVLMWLRGAGCPWDTKCIEAAVQSGCQACVTWIVKHGGPTELACHAALVDVNLPMLSLALRLGCPWRPTDARTLEEVVLDVGDLFHIPGGIACPPPEENAVRAVGLLLHVVAGGHPTYGKEARVLAALRRWSLDLLADELEEALVTRNISHGIVAAAVANVPRFQAAEVIQRHWLSSYYDPEHPVCRRRLARQFAEMAGPVTG